MPTGRWVYQGNGVYRGRTGGGSPPPPEPPTGPVAGALVAPSYPIPTDAIYVAPNGSNSNPGTPISPVQTLARAFQLKATGGNVVMRAGDYPESFTATNSGTVKVYNYPGERVRLLGLDSYTGWSHLGNGVYRTTYAVTLNRFTPYAGADPLRNHSDQFYVNNAPLTQVADGTTPAAGQFSVDQGADTVTIRLSDSSSPVGKTVHGSARKHAIIIGGGPVELYGIEVDGYSPDTQEGGIMAPLYVAGNSHGSVFENCIIRRSSMAGIYIIKTNVTVRNCTLEDFGQDAGFCNNASGLLWERNIVRRVNRGRWNAEPVAAGIKLARTRGARIADSIWEDGWGCRLIWLDVSCMDFEIVNNSIDNSMSAFKDSSEGIMVELSDGGFFNGTQHRTVVAGNRVKGCHVGIKVMNSGYVDVFNNDIEDSRYSAYIWQDDRFNNDSGIGQTSSPGATPTEAAWFTNHLGYGNNVIRTPSLAWGNPIQLLAYDREGQEGRIALYGSGTTPAAPATITGVGMFDYFGGNVFATSAGTMAQIGTATADVRVSYNSPTALAGAGSNVGGPWQAGKFAANYQGTIPADALAPAMPANVAAALGLPVGTKRFGAPLTEPTPVGA